MKPSDTTSSVTDPSVLDAPVLHVDLDAFFASVEILDDPSLRGRPVAVGGAGERGVIASASYEARRFGVRSAMPSVVALRQCPQLVILPGRFDRYEEYSRRFHAIVNDLTPIYEPLGLDEVFADLTSLRRLDIRPLAAAAELRQRIGDELGILSGVGLGPNKLFAKLASKRSKPTVRDGVLVPGPGVVYVDPATREQWLNELPVRALWGVGPATAERLERLGLSSVRELATVDEATLRYHFGPAMAASLSAMARGEDARAVSPSRVNKSIGHEETFAKSLVGYDEVLVQIRRHAGVVARALRDSSQVAHTISVVIRFDDLHSVRRSQTLSFGVDDEGAIAGVAEALAESVPLNAAVRLAGVSASSLRAREGSQVQLAFDLSSAPETLSVEAASRAAQANRAALRDAIDDLRQRFGRSVIAQGSDLTSAEVHVERQRGSHAFGPSTEGSSDTQ